MVENKKPRTLVNLIGAPLLLSIIFFGGPVFTLFIFVIIFTLTNCGKKSEPKYQGELNQIKIII